MNVQEATNAAAEETMQLLEGKTARIMELEVQLQRSEAAANDARSSSEAANKELASIKVWQL